MSRPPDAPMREERRVVSALVADIVGSTALTERLDPEDAREILGEAITRMIQAVESLGGTIKDLAGDGVLALFGAPVAHEDDQERTVRAGLALIQDLASFATDVRERWGVEGFAVRVGIETGVAILGPYGAGSKIEYGATGDALNTAARLQSVAAAGSVLVGAGTRDRVIDLFDWGEPQVFTLKGKAEPVIAFEAIRAKDRPDRRRHRGTEDVRLVGRHDELHAIRRSVEELRSGRGGVVFVTGDVGVGKSRLLAELRAMLEPYAGADGDRWLEGRCASFGENLPYWPYRDLLLGWIGPGGDPVRDLKGALRTRVEHLLGSTTGDVVPYLTAVLGVQLDPSDDANLSALSPEALRFRTFEAMQILIRTLADRRPIVIALDDLQWADPTSLELTQRLIALAEVSPVLLVLATRSDPGRPSWRLVEAGLTRLGEGAVLDPPRVARGG